MDMLNKLMQKGVSRRNFLTGVAGTAAAATLAGCSGGVIAATPTTTLQDADILNFALNLEYLEAEFYLRAATGSGLSSTDAGGSSAGAVNGGAMVPNLSSNAVIQQYAYEIAQNELNHVRFLRSALGPAAVVRPAIDFTAAFTGLASLSGITGGFNPFADINSFLLGAFVFEDVGVTAYHGAAKLLTTPAYLSAAAGIMAVEAYHAAEIRGFIAAQAASSGITTYLTQANQIEAVRASVGGGNETTLSISTIVPADTTNAIAFERTTDQVLHIVYASPAGVVTHGGFFPNGLNGTIKATAA